MISFIVNFIAFYHAKYFIIKSKSDKIIMSYKTLLMYFYIQGAITSNNADKCFNNKVQRGAGGERVFNRRHPYMFNPKLGRYYYSPKTWNPL